MKNVDFKNQSLAENMSLNITWQEGSLKDSYISAALNCDLELESAWLKHKFCIQSHWGEHLTKVK